MNIRKSFTYHLFLMTKLNTSFEFGVADFMIDDLNTGIDNHFIVVGFL